MNNSSSTHAPAAPAMVESRELAAPELRVPDLSLQDFPVHSLRVEEKRRHPRYPCDGHAEVLLPQSGLLFRGRILDLSVSGCFIETTMPDLERGTLVEVFFVAHQLQFRVQGNIAEVRQKRGAGVSFVNLGPRRAIQISALIDELAQQPSD